MGKKTGWRKLPDGALPLFIGEGDHEVVMGCKRVFLKNTNLTNDTNPFGMFLLIAIEFHEYAVRNVFASRFAKENSLKGMKYIAQRQATLGAAPWVRDEGCCAL